MSMGQEAGNTSGQGPDAPAKRTAAPGSASAASAAPPRQLPPYRVLLHNDDMNEMRYVVRTIIELTRLDSRRAMEIMNTAHTKGAALVLITHRERAELFRDQFATKRLKVTIEPAN